MLHAIDLAAYFFELIPSQESNNSLAPITVKLGNYSKWNHSRDFARAVTLPLD